MIDLNQLRNSCIQRRIPLISVPTENFLVQLLKIYQPKNVVEFGSAHGYSALVMGQVLKSRNGHLTTFEVAFPAYQECLFHLYQAHYYHVRAYHRDLSKGSVASFVSQKIDFAFIDARKSHYLEYFQQLQPLFSDHAVIVFDDVIKFKSKLLSLYEFFDQKQIIYEIHQLDPDDGIMVLDLSKNPSLILS